MLKKIIKPTLFLISGGALGWGGWSIYSSQTPKTLEELINWKGYILASFKEDSDNTWKAIYEENKEALQSESEISISAAEEGKKHEKIKEWCKENKDLAVEQLPKGKIEKAILYCTSNFKTVKGKLISQGKKLAEADEDYKVSSTLFSGNSAFSKLISTSNTNKEDWYSLLKTWCGATLIKSPGESGNNVEFAGQWCLKQENRKLKDRLKAKNGNLTELSEGTEGDTSNNGYQKKFEEKKQFQTFFDTLNKYKKDEQPPAKVLTNKDETEAISRLKEFCKDFKEKNVWEIEDYFGTFPLVGAYCYNDNAQKNN